MAEIARFESVPQPRPIPLDLADGLDLFSATWLHQWAEAGGSVYLDADGKAFLGFPSYELSPEYVEPSAELSDWSRYNQHAFLDARYHGKMRGMLSILEALPYGNEALKAHMRTHGMQSYIGSVGGES